MGERSSTTSPVKAFGPSGIIGEQFGDARPRILALHGWGRSHRDFAGVLQGLDAIALDLPGFGATPEPPEAWGAAEYAEAVAEVAGVCEQPLVIAGHSFGGRVALCLAAAHPEAVGGLVLTGVPLLRPGGGSAPKPALRYRLARRLNRWGVLGDDAIERARQRYGSADYKAATGIMREVLVKAINESYEAEIKSVRCPVELVWGRGDTAAPPAVAEAALPMFADADLSVIEDCGHETLADAPDQVVAAIERRLAGLQS